MVSVSGFKGREPPPNDAIQLGVDVDGRAARGIRFNFILLIYMRVVGLLWMFRGLMHWHAILSTDQEPFATMAPSAAAAIIFFAVADLIAAIGLWLATSWGGVLWLFAAASGLVVILATPNHGFTDHMIFGLDLVLIVAYFVFSWYAARERDD